MIVTLHVELHVKFRAFGITFGSVDKTFDVPIALTGPEAIVGGLIGSRTLVGYSDHGVTLNIALRAPSA